MFIAHNSVKVGFQSVMKILTTILIISFFILIPSISVGNDAGPSSSEVEAKKVINQVWKEVTEGGWKYTKKDVNITKQVLVTLVKGVNFINIESHKPLHKEITKLPFVTYTGE